MKKKISRLVAIILVLVFSWVIVVGCASQPTTVSETSGQSAETTAAETKPFKIGIPFLTNSTSPAVIAMIDAMKAAAAAAGGEVVLGDWDFSPDTLITTLEKLIMLEVDGIILANAPDSVLPNVLSLCEDEDLPLLLLSPVMDTAVHDQLKASPLYLGEVYEDDMGACKEAVVRMAKENAVNNLAVLTVAKGDPYGDRRDIGISEAVSETGINLLVTSRNLADATEVKKSVEGILASYPELNGIFISASLNAEILPSVMKVLEDYNKIGTVKVGRIDTDPFMLDYFDKGFLFGYGGQQEPKMSVAFAVMANRIIGTPVSDKPLLLNVKLIPFESKEDVDIYNQYVIESEEGAFSKDEIQQLMIKKYNPDVTVESLQKILNDYNLQDVKARRTK